MWQIDTAHGMMHEKQGSILFAVSYQSVALLWPMIAGTVQYVYAVRDIKKGEQLCVHYTNLHEPRRVRQEMLQQARFFSCACERCAVPIERSVDRFLEVTADNHTPAKYLHEHARLCVQ